MCAVLWVTLTRPTPFSVIRLPYGRLRSRVRQVVRSSHFHHKRSATDGTGGEGGGERGGNGSGSGGNGSRVIIEDEAVNPFAAFAFVELVTPLILGINKLEIVLGSVCLGLSFSSYVVVSFWSHRSLFSSFRPKKKVPRILPTSEINWLFSKINEVGRNLDYAVGGTVFWNDYAGIADSIRKVSGAEHMEFEDHTLEGLKLFWKGLGSFAFRRLLPCFTTSLLVFLWPLLQTSAMARTRGRSPRWAGS